jgi:hypothetical protein
VDDILADRRQFFGQAGVQPFDDLTVPFHAFLLSHTYIFRGWDIVMLSIALNAKGGKLSWDRETNPQGLCASDRAV